MKEVFEYLFPGLMSMWIMFIAQSAMMDMFVESEIKTLRRLSATTLSVSEIILSKFIRCFLLCLLCEFLLIVVTWLIFGMSWGNPLLLVPFLCLCNLSFTGVMALVYGLSKTKESAQGFGIVIIMMAAIVGGGMFPYEEMPAFMKAMADFSWFRWCILGLQTLIFDNPLSNMLWPCVYLAALGVGTTALGMMLFQRRLHSGEL